MAQESHSPDPREIVDETETLKLAEENRELISANYLGEIAVFRADVILKLQSHNALKPGVSWAVFNHSTESADVVEVSRKDTMIMMIASTSPQTPDKLLPPQIRIITNEVMLSESGLEILSEDVTVYPTSRSDYYVNSVEVRDGQIPEDTLASVFTVYDNQLALSDVAIRGTIAQALTDPDLEAPLLPFGDGSKLEDRLYAFSKAKEMLQEILHIEPAYTIDGAPS